MTFKIDHDKNAVTFAHKIVANGVIIILSHTFRQPHRWYYQVLEGFTYEFQRLTHGM